MANYGRIPSESRRWYWRNSPTRYPSPIAKWGTLFCRTGDQFVPANQRICAAVAAVTLLSLAGCASIMSGRHADVAINSNVPNAHVTVRDKRGQEVASLRTPANVALKRKDRFIFPARYTATIEAPGYQPAEVPIRSTVNPWILGNVVFGGIPGLIVDNATGAAWKPKRSQIYQELTPFETAERTAELPADQSTQSDSGTF